MHMIVPGMYGSLLAFCALYFTPKLKSASIQSVKENEYTNEYLHMYGFYVLIFTLYMALGYGMAFMIFTMIGIPFDLFNLFFLSEYFLKTINYSLIANVISIPLGLAATSFHELGFKGNSKTLAQAQFDVDMWALFYSGVSFVVFLLVDNFMLNAQDPAYFSSVPMDVMLKISVIGVISSVTLAVKCFKSQDTDGPNENKNNTEVLLNKRQWIYYVSLFVVVFFIHKTTLARSSQPTET